VTKTLKGVGSGEKHFASQEWLGVHGVAGGAAVTYVNDGLRIGTDLA
jgi:hypothetical protein